MFLLCIFFSPILYIFPIFSICHIIILSKSYIVSFSVSVSHRSTLQQMTTVAQQQDLVPQKTSLPSLNLSPFLHSPTQTIHNHWWSLFHLPLLPFPPSSHPSHLDFRMVPSRSHLLAGSHLQATTPVSQVLHLMFPQWPQFHLRQLFSGCLHLRWCCPLSHLHLRYSLYQCSLQAP